MKKSDCFVDDAIFYESHRLPKPLRIIDQVWPRNIKPLISIFNWSYNHIDYIRESIETILMQKTTVPVEVIIHDDASNDGTKEIIKEYEDKYPHLFCNILQNENQWSQGKCVVQPLFTHPRGKHIALTHGDDYWTDSDKLEIQFNFMLENSDCVGCFHQSRLVDHSGGVVKQNYNNFPQSKYDFIESFELLRSSYSTSSLYFKNIFPRVKLPKWFLQKPNDMAIEIFITQYGKIGYIDKNMSDYRKHDNGIWSQKSLEMQYFELMHRFQIYIDDPEFPNRLKNIARKLFIEISNKHPLIYKVENLENIITDLKSNLHFSKEEIKMIKKSISWKITKPLRVIHDSIFKPKRF